MTGGFQTQIDPIASRQADHAASDSDNKDPMMSFDMTADSNMPRTELKKSYENREWLHSRGARLLRIMAEFMETGDKLRAHGIIGSILVFGSARIRSPEAWAEDIAALERGVAANPEDPVLQQKLKELRRQKGLTQYYHKTAQLAKLLTEWAHTKEAEVAVKRSVSKLPYFFEKTTRFQALAKQDERCSPPAVGVSAPWSPSGLVICTGGGPGMMEAANKGAAQVPGGRSMGMGISLPFEVDLNPYVTDDLRFQYHYFFTRKFWMVYVAMGVVATPGGVGTLDELMEVLTLRQTGRFKTRIPIVLFGKDFWKNTINFEFLRDQGVISDADYEGLFWTDDPQEAFEHIRSTLVRGESVYPGPKKK